MPLSAVGCAVLVGLVLLLGAGCVRSMTARTSTPPPVTTQAIRSMTQQQIRDRLKMLEQSPAPEPTAGAMCYEMAPPPKRSEYVCPRCGEKTLYLGNWLVSSSMDDCRREFEAMKKLSDLSLTLCEPEYCAHCTPGAREQFLTLTVKYTDGTTHVTRPVSIDDLRMLHGFLAGQLSLDDGGGYSHPLKDDLPRLRQILGISLGDSLPKKQR